MLLNLLQVTINTIRQLKEVILLQTESNSTPVILLRFIRAALIVPPTDPLRQGQTMLDSLQTMATQTWKVAIILQLPR